LTQLTNLVKALTASNAAAICASQTPGAAGAMTLTATPVVLDTQRRVLVSCAGNNLAVAFAITGTKNNGIAVGEVLAGTNGGTTESIFDYKTVSSVVISAASTGAVTVGTSAKGSTDWINVESRKEIFSMSVALTLTGAATFSIETTNSHYLASPLFPTSTINVVPSTVTAAVASTVWAPSAIVHAWRLTITAGTGSVAADAVTAGAS
jgi:hypothetical protein